jgi:3',5'-cyclic AMP phosphodiesterase CpdA
MRSIVFRIVPAILILASQAPSADLELPLKDKSVRFAVIGDSGTGDQAQYSLAREMARIHEKFPFEFVLMLGDNIYGGDRPSDMRKKFEDPYRALSDANVKFYASLGNHDNPNQRFYKPFNMGGRNYYSFKVGKAEFFALDSNYMDARQLDWLKNQLKNSNSQWKICFFHHPLYSDGRFHGSDRDLRARLQPLLEQYGVNVVFSGHEHIYERFKPQNGIVYFVLGNSGQLRSGNLSPSNLMAKGFDTDRAFMIVEITDDGVHFQTITGSSKTADSGTIDLVKKAAAAGSQ